MYVDTGFSTVTGNVTFFPNKYYVHVQPYMMYAPYLSTSLVVHVWVGFIGTTCEHLELVQVGLGTTKCLTHLMGWDLRT